MRGRTASISLILLLLTASAIGAAAPQGETPTTAVAWSAETDDRVPDVVVVGFTAMPTDLDAWAAARGAEVLLADEVLRFASLRFVDAAAAAAAISTLSTEEDIRYAEHEFIQHLQYLPDPMMGLVPLPLPAHTPNDPLYGDQWGFGAIKAPQAWYHTLGSHDAVVAVLDTGIEGTHPDLAANICGPHASFVAGEPPLEDLHFHGTHVAGSVAAVTDNGIGVAGTSQSCLMSVQVCTQFGSCPSAGSSAGIRWAADNGAHVISMSFGGGGMSSAQRDAVEYAYHEQGVLLIAAAGNSGCSTQDRVIYPAKFPQVVAVAALASPGNIVAGFSSCGPEVEIAAPGASVLSTNRLGGYRYASGTSMAAPHASGVAGLIKSAHPDLTAPQLRCILAQTTDDILAIGPDINTGWGRVNALSGIMLGVVPPVPEATMPPAPNLMQIEYLLANSCDPQAMLAQ